MKKKWILWSTLLASATFFVLLWLWWNNSSGGPELAPQKEQMAVSKTQKEKASLVPVQESPPSSKIKKVDLKKEPVDEVSTHKRFMRELDKLDFKVHEEANRCYDEIEDKLDDLNFIDPQSEFYQNMDKVESLLHDTILSMGAGHAEMANWEIENYIQKNEPPNIEYLIERHSQNQETCLLPSGIMFIQTAIESCRDKCPLRLKRVIGNIVFDGLPLMMANHSGAKRVLLSLSIMETANRYGPYHIAMNGEIQDLRFRVQRNYEVYQEELQQNEGRSARQAQAFRSFMQENEFLKEEVLSLLTGAAERYYP